MGPKVLVTGSAGFIGSHLCCALKEAGMSVTGMDDYSTGTFVPREGKRGKYLWSHWTVDVHDREHVRWVMAEERPDIVVHLAALVDVGALEEDPGLALSVNTGGTRVVVEEAGRVQNCVGVILASSAAVYGDTAFRCTESTPLDPIGIYGESKRQAEWVLHRCGQEAALHTAALRFSNVYGTRQRIGILPKWIQALLAGRQLPIYGEGTQTRDWVHVDDVVDGIRCVIQHMLNQDVFAGGSVHNTWNLSSGTSMDVLTVADLISTAAHMAGLDLPVFKRSQPLPAADIPFSSMDSREFARMFDWSPRKLKAAILAELIQYAQQNAGIL